MTAGALLDFVVPMPEKSWGGFLGIVSSLNIAGVGKRTRPLRLQDGY